jgi:hypothetical protein
MTQREKRLATVLLGVLALLGGGIGFHALALEPYREAAGRLDKAKGDLDDKENELLLAKTKLRRIVAKDPRLEHWKKIALPSTSAELRQRKDVREEDKKRMHRRNLQVEYDRFLRELLVKSGFVGPINIKAQDIKEQFEEAPKGQTVNTKMPLVYERMPFTVNGQAKLGAVVRMFEGFYRARVLHQIRTFTISIADKQGASKKAANLLNVYMTVEALIVPGAEERPRLEPDYLPRPMRVLADEKPKPTKGDTKPMRVLVDPRPMRDYLVLTRKDPFLGVAPVEENTTGPSGPREKTDEVLRFVRLTMIATNATGRRWEGYIYNLGAGGFEKRVNAVTLTELHIRDKYDNTVLEGEVVLVEEEQLIFKAGGKFYRLRVGDFFLSAVRNPLTTKEVKELGLDPEKGE